jgi:UDP-glucose 4-epimerase
MMKHRQDIEDEARWRLRHRISNQRGLCDVQLNCSEAMEWAEQFAGSSILVTGGSGFIGEHLCDRLWTCGARVHAVSRELHSSNREEFRWWQADFNDISAVCQVVKAVKPKFVFHLASYVGGARDLKVVLPTFYDNLASTVHLLNAVAEVGCRRIVLANSGEEPQSFDDTAFPCSPYAAAKWASSIYGRMFYQLFQTPVVMPRIFMVYGPKQKDVQKLVPYVVCRLLRGEAPTLSSGRRLADWIYVDDVVEGLLRAAVASGVEGCAFDLGSGSLVSVRGVVEQIAEIVDSTVEPVFGALSDRPYEQERPADTSFLSNRLGFRPRTTLKQGLDATVTWYRQQLGLTVDGSMRDFGTS